MRHARICLLTLISMNVDGSSHVTVIIESVFPSDILFWPMVSVMSNADNSAAI